MPALRKFILSVAHRASLKRQGAPNDGTAEFRSQYSGRVQVSHLANGKRRLLNARLFRQIEALLSSLQLRL
jgi:hypothetical protein